MGVNIFTAIGIFLLIVLAFCIVAEILHKIAPDGYEDKDGFHYGDPPGKDERK